MLKVKVNESWVKINLSPDLDSQTIEGFITEIPHDFLLQKFDGGRSLDLEINGEQFRGYIKRLTPSNTDLYIRIEIQML